MGRYAEPIRVAVIAQLKAATSPSFPVWSKPPVNENLPLISLGGILLDEPIDKAGLAAWYLVGVECWVPADSPRVLDQLARFAEQRLTNALPSTDASLSGCRLAAETEEAHLDYPPCPALARVLTFRLLAQPLEN